MKLVLTKDFTLLGNLQQSAPQKVKRANCYPATPQIAILTLLKQLQCRSPFSLPLFLLFCFFSWFRLSKS